MSVKDIVVRVSAEVENLESFDELGESVESMVDDLAVLADEGAVSLEKFEKQADRTVSAINKAMENIELDKNATFQINKVVHSLKELSRQAEITGEALPAQVVDRYQKLQETVARTGNANYPFSSGDVTYESILAERAADAGLPGADTEDLKPAEESAAVKHARAATVKAGANIEQQIQQETAAAGGGPPEGPLHGPFLSGAQRDTLDRAKLEKASDYFARIAAEREAEEHAADGDAQGLVEGVVETGLAVRGGGTKLAVKEGSEALLMRSAGALPAGVSGAAGAAVAGMTAPLMVATAGLVALAGGLSLLANATEDVRQAEMGMRRSFGENADEVNNLAKQLRGLSSGALSDFQNFLSQTNFALQTQGLSERQALGLTTLSAMTAVAAEQRPGISNAAASDSVSAVLAGDFGAVADLGLSPAAMNEAWIQASKGILDMSDGAAVMTARIEALRKVMEDTEPVLLGQHEGWELLKDDLAAALDVLKNWGQNVVSFFQSTFGQAWQDFKGEVGGALGLGDQDFDDRVVAASMDGLDNDELKGMFAEVADLFEEERGNRNPRSGINRENRLDAILETAASVGKLDDAIKEGIKAGQLERNAEGGLNVPGGGEVMNADELARLASTSTEAAKALDDVEKGTRKVTNALQAMNDQAAQFGPLIRQANLLAAAIRNASNPGRREALQNQMKGLATAALQELDSMVQQTHRLQVQLERLSIQRARAEEDIAKGYKRAMRDANISLARQFEAVDRQLKRSIEDRTRAMAKWADATDRVYNRYAPSITAVLANMEAQNARLRQWLDDLAELRDRGLSEDAIRVLGLDDPSNYSQIARIANATDEELAELNALIDERMASSAEGAEATLTDTMIAVERQREDILIAYEQSIQDLDRRTMDAMADLSISMQRQAEDIARQMADIASGVMAYDYANGFIEGVMKILGPDSPKVQELLSVLQMVSGLSVNALLSGINQVTGGGFTGSGGSVTGGGNTGGGGNGAGEVGRPESPGATSGGYLEGTDDVWAEEAPAARKAKDMAAAAVDMFGGKLTSGYRDAKKNAAVGGSPTSYHMDATNPAQDLVTPDMNATFDWLYKNYGPNIREMIYGHKKVRSGSLGRYSKEDHWDHIHIAHTGGVVQSDWPTLGGLRSDERPAVLQLGEGVVPRDTMQMVSRMVATNRYGGSSGANYTAILSQILTAMQGLQFAGSKTTNFGPIKVEANDPREMQRQLEAEARRRRFVGGSVNG